MRCVSLASCLVASLILSANASAALIAYEGFDYDTSSSTALVGQSGGTGWTGAWADQGGDLVHELSTDGSLTSPVAGISSIGERAVSTGAGTGSSSAHRITRGFPTLGSNSDSTLYVSFLMKKTDNASGSANNLEFDLRGSSGTSSRWVRTGSGSSDVLLLRPNTNQVGTATPITEGETFFMVLKVHASSVVGGDTVSLTRFSSSDTLSTEPVTWDLHSSGFDLQIDLDRIQLWTGVTTSGEFDEIRIADTWDSAIGVPEPSCWLMLLGGVSLVGLYRRTC